jgi:hypothetical protein
MNVGLRAVLLLVAVIFFVVAIFSDLHQGDFMAVGLAFLAGAWLVTELGWDRPLGSGMNRNRT